MIGVALDSGATHAVAEFFELFKTPWEWAWPDTRYEVLISDRSHAPARPPALLIQLPPPRGGTGATAPAGPPAMVRGPEGRFPVYGRLVPVLTGECFQSAEDLGIPAGSRETRDGTTVIRLGYHPFDELAWLLNRHQPAELAAFPTLELHIAQLRSWILAAGIPLAEIPPRPGGRAFFACLSHDVDFAGIRYYPPGRTLAGFLGRALAGSIGRYRRGELDRSGLARNWAAVARLPLLHLGLARDFWSTFRDYRTLEGDAPSTFFFVPYAGRPGLGSPAIRAVRYELDDLAPDLAALLAEGCEVGVHGLDAWTDESLGRGELDRVRTAGAPAAAGIRMHWLRFDAGTPARLEAAGYAYDATVGYNERVGYRAGTLQPFRPEGCRTLLELPLHIMDSALFYRDRMGLSLAEGQAAMVALMDDAERFGGVLSLNWHDRSIAPERLWDGVYRSVLAELRRRGARFLTARGAADWFARRRALRFAAVTRGGAGPRIGLAGPRPDPAEGLVLRLHTPGAEPAVRDLPIGGPDGIPWHD